MYHTQTRIKKEGKLQNMISFTVGKEEKKHKEVCEEHKLSCQKYSKVSISTIK